MGITVAEVMSINPITLDAHASILVAAQAMRERDIGDVIVQDNGEICGIVTDRDVVVRGIAEGHNPADIALRDICSRDLTTVAADADIEEAVQLMRERALRRLPVVRYDRLVGIVSIGDLAIENDPTSALANISAALPNT